MQTLVIIGAGGLGKEAAWVAANMNAVLPRFVVAGFCDDCEGVAEHFGFPVLGNIEHAAGKLTGSVVFYCAIGTNATREKVVARALAVGWKPCPPPIDMPAAAADNRRDYDLIERAGRLAWSPTISQNSPLR